MIVVTGSAGYIGEELCKYLLNKGEDVIQVDSVFNKRAEEYITDNIEFFRNAKYIVHLAAISGIQACQNNIKEATLSNVIATQHIMKFASDYKIPMVFASSAAANNPSSSFYATTKFLGEQTAKYYNENYDADITVLRFSNVYGGKNYLKKKNSVIAKFLNASAQLKPLEVDGDGSQTRDFIHVKRIIEVIDAVIAGRRVNAPYINVCTGQNMAINFLAKWIGGANVIYKNSDRVGVASAEADPYEVVQLMGLNWVEKVSTDLIDFMDSEAVELLKEAVKLP